MDPFNPQHFLQDFGFGESEAEVYLAVLGGAQSPREVIMMTGRSRPTVYQSLAGLAEKGLIEEVGSGESLRYQAASLDSLSVMLSEREAKLAHLQGALHEFTRRFAAPTTFDRRPNVTVLEGDAAVRRAVAESLYSHGREVLILLPRETYLERLGAGYLEQYFDLVNSLGLRGEILIAPGVLDRIGELKGVLQQYTLNRALADRMTTSFIIYDDVVLNITNLPGGYGWKVVSREVADSSRALLMAAIVARD